MDRRTKQDLMRTAVSLVFSVTAIFALIEFGPLVMVAYCLGAFTMTMWALVQEMRLGGLESQEHRLNRATANLQRENDRARNRRG